MSLHSVIRRRVPLRHGLHRRAASETAWDPRTPPRQTADNLPNAPTAPETKTPPSPSPASTLPKPRLNFKKIIADPTHTTHNFTLRRAPIPRDTVFHITRLYETSLTLRRKLDSARHKQRDIGAAIKAGGGAGAVEQARKVKRKVGEYAATLEETERELLEIGMGLPNDTFEGTPVGGEAVAERLGTVGRVVDGEEEQRGPDAGRDHLAVAQYWGWLDPAAAATATGTSWVYLKGTLALLEQAVVQYAMSLAVSHGWQPVAVPDVVKEDIMHRCGFTPRDPSQVGQTYYVSTTHPGTDTPAAAPTPLVLAATAEIPLAALNANSIIPHPRLPLKHVGISHAFRAEAGARGADTRGLYRLHQFTKVELFAVTQEGDDARMMDEILALQRELVRGLGLSVRVLEMPTEELGAPAYRKVDMEAWMPGRGKWGEISSTSNCTDYQARRLHIRYRPASPASEGGADALPFAHTLNGTCAAVPRLLIALLENGVVLEAGKPVGIRLPRALRRFWFAGDTFGEGERTGRIEWV